MQYKSAPQKTTFVRNITVENLSDILEKVRCTVQGFVNPPSVLFKRLTRFLDEEMRFNELF